MLYQIDTLKDIEDNLVCKIADERNVCDLSTKEQIEKELNVIFSDVHKCVIANLISTYVSNKCKQYRSEDFSKYFEGSLKLPRFTIFKFALNDVLSQLLPVFKFILNSLYILSTRNKTWK